MADTRIQLEFLHKSGTWTVVINGEAHRNLPSVVADELVEYAMVAAEQAEYVSGGDSQSDFLDLHPET